MRGVRNWPVLLKLRGQGGSETRLELRDGTQFAVRSLMDAWIVKETNLDRDYEVHGDSDSRWLDHRGYRCRAG